MPKYFDGDLPLPYPRVNVSLRGFSEAWLVEQLAKNKGQISLCFRLDGFPPDSLGYVFHIEKSGEAFHVSDITKKQLLSVPSAAQLVAMVLHASGAKYEADWQVEFQRLRNEITSN